ncbi:MAG: hypothetical protein AAB392_01335 [Patescibacteria group bacterium]
MDFDKISDAIKKSPHFIKNMLFSDKIGGLAQNIAWKHDLSEDDALKFSDEIGYVILGLKSRFNFSDSLIQFNIAKDAVGEITKEVEEEIFSELDRMEDTNSKYVPEQSQKNIRLNNILTQQPLITSVQSLARTFAQQSPKPEKQNNIAVSFEETVLNQARAMQPAKPADGGIMNQELRIKREQDTLPNNLPTENTINEVRDYKAGADPYREPVE